MKKIINKINTNYRNLLDNKKMFKIEHLFE